MPTCIAKELEGTGGACAPVAINNRVFMKTNTSKSSRIPAITPVIILFGLSFGFPRVTFPPRSEASFNAAAAEPEGYAGSWSCRECHEKFYQLWAPSHHGLAMQPVTPEFLTKLEAQKIPIIVKDHRYQAFSKMAGVLSWRKARRGRNLTPWSRLWAAKTSIIS